MNVYFISGLCANCKVFDRIKLPDNYNKVYIEWRIPSSDETLEAYSRLMAEEIETSDPFILVGYSLGGFIVQEMNKFLSPVKNIIISSLKAGDEIPPLLRLGRMINFAEHFPMQVFSDHTYILEIFARMVYQATPLQTNDIVSYTDPVYMRWALNQILNWKPELKYENLYHIHGMEDLVFPYKYVKETYPVERGDHFMLIKRSRLVNKILAEILQQ